MKASTLSAEDKRTLLESALNPSSVGRDVAASPSAWIRDIWDDKLVYDVGGKYYQVKYSIDSNGGVKLGAAVEVMRQTVYKPVQSKEGKKYPFIGK